MRRCGGLRLRLIHPDELRSGFTACFARHPSLWRGRFPRQPERPCGAVRSRITTARKPGNKRRLPLHSRPRL